MKWVVVVASLACAAEASAQAFNLDFGSGVVPDSSYGAGAEQAGTWNQVIANSGGLTTTDGQTSFVTYTNSMFDGSVSIPGAGGDDAVLMSDYLYNSGGRTLHLTNLTGDFMFYLYGWAAPLDGPSGTGGTTTFKIGIPGGNSQQVTLDYSDPWPGMQVEGNTYAKIQVHIPSFASFIIVSVDPPGLGYSIIQGMQIAPIPGPPVAVVGLVGGVAVVRRRR